MQPNGESRSLWRKANEACSVCEEEYPPTIIFDSSAILFLNVFIIHREGISSTISAKDSPNTPKHTMSNKALWAFSGPAPVDAARAR
jgi:hypothetical protein